MISNFVLVSENWMYRIYIYKHIFNKIFQGIAITGRNFYISMNKILLQYSTFLRNRVCYSGAKTFFLAFLIFFSHYCFGSSTFKFYGSDCIQSWVSFIFLCCDCQRNRLLTATETHCEYLLVKANTNATQLSGCDFLCHFSVLGAKDKRLNYFWILMMLETPDLQQNMVLLWVSCAVSPLYIQFTPKWNNLINGL